MKNLIWVIGFLLFLFCINAAYSQKPKVEVPGTEVIKFNSVIDSQQCTFTFTKDDKGKLTGYNFVYFDTRSFYKKLIK